MRETIKTEVSVDLTHIQFCKFLELTQEEFREKFCQGEVKTELVWCFGAMVHKGSVSLDIYVPVQVVKLQIKYELYVKEEGDTQEYFKEILFPLENVKTEINFENFRSDVSPLNLDLWNSDKPRVTF